MATPMSTAHPVCPPVDKLRAELDRTELLAVHALAAIAPAVMTAHIVYPAARSDHLATLSKAILGGILRGEGATAGHH